MDADARNRLLEALGIAESIAIRLREEYRLLTPRFTTDEHADIARSLREIEDRLYSKGEYAAGNAATTR